MSHLVFQHPRREDTTCLFAMVEQMLAASPGGGFSPGAVAVAISQRIGDDARQILDRAVREKAERDLCAVRRGAGGAGAWKRLPGPDGQG